MKPTKAQTVEEAIKKIKEAQAPLTLNLSSNNIGEAGAKFFAQSIKEAGVLLTLDLYNNNVGDAGIRFFVQSIKEARVPVTLDLRSYVSHAGWSLCNAERDNFIIDARRSSSEFFAKLKFNPFKLLGLKPILIQTPVVEELIGLNYPKDIAIIVQEYAHDADYLAWKVVAAIRAIEGASHENKYASINYELLTAVYSTAPVAYGLGAEGQQAITTSFPPKPSGLQWTSARMVGIELFCKKLLYRQDLKKFAGMIDGYGIELPSGLTTVDYS